MATHARDPEFPETRPTLEKPPSSGGRSDQQAAECAVGSFSIVVRGPIYDLLLRFRLVRESLRNISHRIVAVIAVTWLPLLLLSLKDGVAFGHRVRVPFVYDVSMYGRFLLA